MSALEKAQAALRDAAAQVADDPEFLNSPHLPPKYHRLLDLAQKQAADAQAEALADIADSLRTATEERR